MARLVNTFEEDSYFPSMTDLMVGIIFIFIIIVMTLILQIQDVQEKSNIPDDIKKLFVGLSVNETTKIKLLIENRDINDGILKKAAILEIENKKYAKTIQENNNIIKENEKIIDKLNQDLNTAKSLNNLYANEKKNYAKTIQENNNIIKENEKIIDKLNQDLNTAKSLNNTLTQNTDKEIKELIDKLEDQIELKLQNNTLEQKIKDNDIKIIELNNQLILRENELENLNTLSKKTTTNNINKINQLNNKLNLREKELNDLKTEIKTLTEDNKDFVSLQDEISNKENEIRNLNNRIDTLEQKSSDYEVNKEKFINEYIELKQEAEKIILEAISNDLTKKGIKVQVILNNAVLRLDSSDMFSGGSPKLNKNGKYIIRKVSETLNKILPCFANDPEPVIIKSFVQGKNEKAWIKFKKKYNIPKFCNEEKLKISNFIKISSISIEGHTDHNKSRCPQTGPECLGDDWELSSKRAISTYQEIYDNSPLMATLTNKNNQMIFGVGGYGHKRPVIRNEKNESDRKLNRRIELRLILDTLESDIIKLID